MLSLGIDEELPMLPEPSKSPQESGFGYRALSLSELIPARHLTHPQSSHTTKTPHLTQPAGLPACQPASYHITSSSLRSRYTHAHATRQIRQGSACPPAWTITTVTIRNHQTTFIAGVPDKPNLQRREVWSWAPLHGAGFDPTPPPGIAPNLAPEVEELREGCGN
jgi:hypothetical protein